MKNKRKGIRIILIFLPFIIVIFALYAAIISTTVVVDNTLKDIISEMDRVSSCNKNISGLQSRNSKMSETSTAFVEAPIVPPYSVPTPAPRELNSMPIGAYVEELTTSATPDSILEELDKLGLEKELLAEVSKAVENMNLMNEAQYKAIYVVKYYVDNSENTDNETGYRIREEIKIKEGEISAKKLILIKGYNKSLKYIIQKNVNLMNLKFLIYLVMKL